jgi:hypothetical protein
MDQEQADWRSSGPDRSFVLRLWSATQGGATGRPQWRITLQDTSTGTRRGFATPEEFLVFIEELCAQDPAR